eukprot:6044490-Amphidinium_carterae.2
MPGGSSFLSRPRGHRRACAFGQGANCNQKFELLSFDGEKLSRHPSLERSAAVFGAVNRVNSGTHRQCAARASRTVKGICALAQRWRTWASLSLGTDSRPYGGGWGTNNRHALLGRWFHTGA